MTEPLFNKEDYLCAVLDAIPSMVFVMDYELKVLYASREASKVLGEEPELLLKRLCGDILRCIHHRESQKGCGTTPSCPDCIIRQAVQATRIGQTVSRKMHRMLLNMKGEERRVCFLVSAASFEYRGTALVLVTLEDISELTELRSIVPMCASCHKIRNDKDYWEYVENYLKQSLDIGVTHGICPECREKLYPKTS